MDYIKEIEKVLIEAHGKPVQYIETVAVKETHQNETVWDGNVEVFSIAHEKTDIVFAWGYEEHGHLHVISVLALPPILSPLDAVRAAILNHVNNYHNDT